MSDRPSHLYVLLTDEQDAALRKACDAHKRRTGMRPNLSEATRIGLTFWCASVGVRFPEYEPRNQPARRRRARPNASGRTAHKASSDGKGGRAANSEARTAKHSPIARDTAG